ncbi:MAG: diacylglycerol kinase family lipid kinase [Lachnospiraceae bacterium]|jgi:YegS/Rv2252/BmrU family lipid kinase|nr:diacylglycerol kinase family lipid kinase [Lachnospiraceae bacterium]
MANLLFIYNPYAGKARIRSNLLDIIDIFTKAGYTVTARPTQAAGDAGEIFARLTQDYDLIVCCGGDGTLGEVVRGMKQYRVLEPLGIIPAGTSNDFARSLNITGDMKKAAEQICRRQAFECDLGFFNETPYNYVASFGLFTDVAYETKQSIKNSIGHMAYVLEGIKRLTDLQTTRMKVVAEEMEIEDDFLFGMVTNSLSVGGFKNITGKRVKLDDGLFEVTLITKPRNPLELNNLMTALVMRKLDADCMHLFKSSQLLITAATPTSWSLDGEYGGEHQNVTIRNERKGLAIYC